MYLLQAVDLLVNQQHRDLHLVILGTGESESALQEFINAHQLQSHVTLQGFVQQPADWYRKADLFVLSSLYEGMPNALIEAVACGTPVISTDCPSGPAEILDQGRCGPLVPPADSQALATAIADSLDHPDKGQFLAGIAQKRVRELFDPDHQISLLEDLFLQIAGRKM